MDVFQLSQRLRVAERGLGLALLLHLLHIRHRLNMSCTGSHKHGAHRVTEIDLHLAWSQGVLQL